MAPSQETDQYTYHVPPPCNEEVEVIYNDDQILVVDKPSGLLSVPGRYVKDCVQQRVQFDFPDARVVHRLDLDTSGLLVFALSQQAVSELNRLFRERLIQKTYIARVDGQLLANEGVIDLPMRADSDNRPRQVIDKALGKSAITRFEVMERDETSTLVRLQPETGRSHQLRLHMAAIGHPMLGCDLYAHEQALACSPRLYLHAWKLAFSLFDQEHSFESLSKSFLQGNKA
jgi:tRNA pseudouridine32 synthase/23S rRNA pseudouridine746 synthase